MRISAQKALVALAASATIGGCTLPDPVVFQSLTLEKCQKAIESESPKFEKKVFGALKKCKDLYRAAVADNDPLAEPAAKCDAALMKVLLFPDAEGKSAVAKAKVKLDSFTDPAKLKCSDIDLVALGHLPTVPFGDLWARLLLVQRIGAAVAGQVAAVRDTPDIFTALAVAGCTRCGAIAAPPCFATTCSLTPASATEFIGTPFVIPSGNLSLSVCRNSDLLGPDFGLFAGPAKSIDALDVTSVSSGYMCATTIGGEGYIDGIGSVLPRIAPATCQDHIVNSPDSDECPAFLGFPSICASATSDNEHAAVMNGGPCAAFPTGGPVAGMAFLMGAVRLYQTCDGNAGCGGVDQRGADGIPCTADDTGTQGPSFPIPLTTLSAFAFVLDSNNTDGVTQALASPPVGIAFNPLKVSGGDLSGGKLVGGLPGLHTGEDNPNPDVDSVLGVQLVCG